MKCGIVKEENNVESDNDKSWNEDNKHNNNNDDTISDKEAEV